MRTRVRTKEGGFRCGESEQREGPQSINRRTLYLATSYQGVWISRDAGESWHEWNEGLEAREAGTNGNNVANVLAISADGNTLYFGTLGAGVWKRTIEQ